MNNAILLLTLMLSASAETLPPIACNLKALTSEQRRHLEEIGKHVIAAITTSRDSLDSPGTM
jgi:hypothetical protein